MPEVIPEVLWLILRMRSEFSPKLPLKDVFTETSPHFRKSGLLSSLLTSERKLEVELRMIK
jgi:hypothetical protein